MFEDDLDVWRVGLFGISEEVDGLNQKGMDELLGGMGCVTRDRQNSWKDSI